MTCAHCGRHILPTELTCRACLEQRARAAAILAAGRHIPDYLHRGLELRMASRSRFSPTLHIVVPNFWETFCGEPLKDQKYRTAKKLNEALEHACSRCTQRFEELLKKEQTG